MYYYDNHNIPHIKNHILKSKTDAIYYGKLKSALDALSDYDYDSNLTFMTLSVSNWWKKKLYYDEN